jgi:hypothetical protein
MICYFENYIPVDLKKYNNRLTIAGHWGADGKLYLLDFSRVYPPEDILHVRRYFPSVPSRGLFYRMLRPGAHHDSILLFKIFDVHFFNPLQNWSAPIPCRCVAMPTADGSQPTETRTRTTSRSASMRSLWPDGGEKL